MTNQVDFIIVGSAKSGTTALALMLDQHPDVYMSEIKETNYFIRGFEDTRHYLSLNGKLVLADQEESGIVDSAEKYAALFNAASDTQLLGEASPWYLLNNQVPSRLLEYNPNVKVIIILRNPADVAFANFVHQVRDRAESLSVTDMDEFFDTARYQNDKLHPFCNHLCLPKYSQHLPLYLNKVPAQNLHLMIYEEFRQDRRAALSDLFNFLGLRDDIRVDVEKKVNISGLPRSGKLQDLIQGSMVFKKLLRLFLSKKPRRRLRAYIEALNTGEKALLKEISRAQLDALYTDDVCYVEEVMGRPISAWREQRLISTGTFEYEHVVKPSRAQGPQ